MIRPMRVPDASRMGEIHVFAQRVAYRGFVSDEFLFGDKMSVQKRIGYFAEGTADAYIFDDGIIKGFITLGPCKDDDKPNTLELYRIFVDPFMFGQGIGGKLATHFEDVAKKKGHDDICLWVLQGNTNAQAFYEKLGYVADGAVRISEYFGVPEVRYVKEI